MHSAADKKRKQSWNIYWASGIVSICGIIFQVLFGALGSYMLGDSVKQYALTIGVFLSGMGIGAAVSEKMRGNLVFIFIAVEFAIALIGGTSALTMFGITAYLGTFTGQLYLLFVTLLIGALSGLELPILIRKANDLGVALNKSTARVLFSDYAGSLLGTLAFALFLRFWLGLIRTAFAIALINLAVAIWLIIVFRHELKRVPWMRFTAGVLALFMIAGVLVGEKVAYAFEKRMYQDQVVHVQETPYQRIVVTREHGDTRLFLDGNLQFSSVDEYRYHEPLVHIPMHLTEHHDRILVLGGGDGLVVRELLKYDDLGEVVLVDLDAEMIGLARENPLLTEVNEGSLESEKLTIVHDDAFRYVRDHPELFDVMIVDLPDPNNETLNKLYTREFYALLKKRLMPGGKIAIQGTSPVFARDVYWTINATVQAAGLETDNYHVDVPSFGNWGFVLASREPINPERIEALTFDIPTRYLTANIVPGLFTFGKDEGPPDKPLKPNTMNHPILMKHYQQAWEHYN